MFGDPTTIANNLKNMNPQADVYKGLYDRMTDMYGQEGMDELQQNPGMARLLDALKGAPGLGALPQQGGALQQGSPGDGGWYQGGSYYNSNQNINSPEQAQQWAQLYQPTPPVSGSSTPLPTPTPQPIHMPLPPTNTPTQPLSINTYGGTGSMMLPSQQSMSSMPNIWGTTGGQTQNSLSANSYSNPASQSPLMSGLFGSTR
jgi:hypothetical protein